MIRAGNIAHMEKEEIYTNFRFETLSRRGHLVDLSLDGDNTKIDLRDTGCEGSLN
jgi:hypothetical protein